MGIRIFNEKAADINKGMTGLFFEDINFAADGGIYAEMIENRSFESVKNIRNRKWLYDGGYGWSAYPESGYGADMTLMDKGGLNENNVHYMRFTPSETQKCLKNKAYDGIYAEKGKSYKVSAYARSQSGAPLKVKILKYGEIVAEAVLAESTTPEWVKYEAVITARKTVRFADFVLETDSVLDLDMVSCMPSDAVMGIFRRDLAELLKAVKPGFLRFPGGCIIEGFNLANRYQWKHTLGDIAERKENWNRWSGHVDGFHNYNQSYGLGFYEYFLLCEYLECKPLPVISCTLACQFQSGEMVDFDSPEFENYIQDALDLIEFANGGSDTKYGKIRAEMGHSEPFGMELLSIGNEQWITENNRFFERYERFEQAIHAKYPEIKLISTAGPEVLEPRYDAAWAWIRPKMSKNPDFAYVVDEHYYREPEWFYEHINFYDDYPRDVKVFAGEYASRRRNLPNDPGANTWEAALSEAAYLTMTERNADVVYMQSYAPLFARLGYTQWSPDMIWFDDCTSYGSPSYYVQYLYGNNSGDYTLKNDFLEYSKVHGVYGTACFNAEKGVTILKIANPKNEAVKLDLELCGFKPVSAEMELIAAAPEAVNSIEKPTAVAPVKSQITVSDNFALELPAYSFAVVNIK